MKKELDSLLQTAEKAFAVELLTMPAAVRKMKRKEVLGECTRPCAWGYGRKPGNLVAFIKRFALSAQYFKQVSSSVTLQMLGEHSCSSRLICVTQGIELGD